MQHDAPSGLCFLYEHDSVRHNNGTVGDDSDNDNGDKHDDNDSDKGEDGRDDDLTVVVEP